MQTSDIFIGAVGVHLPPMIDAATAAGQGLCPAEKFAETGLTGAVVAGELSAPDLAVHAARQALDRWAGDPGEIDLMLHVCAYHQGPDGWVPATYVQRQTIGGHAPAIEIRNGCNGMFAAMELAAGRLLTDPACRSALLVAADNFTSPLIDRWKAGPVFVLGDAGSALVLTREPGFAQLLAVNSVSVPELEELHRGGDPLYPPGVYTGQVVDYSARAAYVREHGTALAALHTVGEIQRQLVEDTLAQAGLKRSDISRVACVNFSEEATAEHVLAPAGFTLDDAVWQFGRGLGHLSASDQVVSFDHLLGAGELTPGDRLLMLGMSGGMSFACAVVDILEHPSWLR